MRELSVLEKLTVSSQPSSQGGTSELGVDKGCSRDTALQPKDLLHPRVTLLV